MADDNAELQARLRDLDDELNDGDITRKGYEKRRTALFSQFLSPQQLASLRLDDGGAQQSSDIPADSAHSPHTSPRISLGSESAHVRQASHNSFNSSTYGQPQPSSGQGGSNGFSGYGNGAEAYGAGYDGGPPSQVARFQEQQLGMRQQAPQRMGSYGGSSGPTRPESQNSQYSSPDSTMVGSGSYAFKPTADPNTMHSGEWGSSPEDSRVSTMLDSQHGYFSDFTGNQVDEHGGMRESYGGPQRYSQGEAFSPTANMPPPLAEDMPSMPVHQLPLEPRELPFAVYDPHNKDVPMSKFDNLGTVLRHRAKMQGRQPAYWVVDQKGKEISGITWEKLASRAEKVAQVIRDKSNLYRGDRVALVYKDTEIIDFAIALFGCFIAGVVAVPINNLEDYQKLSLLLTTTQAHLALTTDNNLKAFSRDISAQRLKWPTGVEWWKTNEFGSYSYKKKDDSTPLQVPDLAYIEFTRAPTGDFRGVVLSHRTIMHQMACLSAILSTIPKSTTSDTFSSQLRSPDGSYIVPRSGRGDTILSYLDPREGCGLILGVLLGAYGGHTTVWLESKTVDTPGMYAHLITKYRATVMVADYPGLKRAAYNYQQDPMATRNFKKNAEPNFSSVRICLIDTLTVDCEFHEVLADRWLRPMRNQRARELVAPMLCLPEHGGMIISIRDWLGGEERMGCELANEDGESEDDEEEPEPVPTTNGFSSLLDGSASEKQKQKSRKRPRTELSEVLLDKESLKTNEVVVLATGDEVRKRSSEPGTIRAGAFGWPIPDATVALVDPDTNLLCAPYAVGELWVDSPSLSGGFWALPRHTETIFHARPYRFVEGSPTPVLVEPEFLRTGLLGCIIDGKIFVLGLYEDRIRQRVEWTEHGQLQDEYRYFFVQHLVVSVMKGVPNIYDCSAFDAHVNGEYLPIILIETQAASTAPTTTGGPPRQLEIPFLDTLSERVMEVLYQEHHLRVFCVMMTAPNSLPRVVKNGRREIGNMRCRKEFDTGDLRCVHVKFGVERAVQNLPLGDDPAGGIWSAQASLVRQDMLALHADKQYSGVDHREIVIDDRTSTPLNQFSNIHDLMQWRVSRQAEELCYCTIDGRGREGKGINWKKFDLRVAAVAMYLKNKAKVQPGDRLVLMYTHSEDFVYALHACICLGAVAIPAAPIDSNRLNEDSPALLHMMADFRVKAVLVNNDVDQLLKQKAVSQHLKQSALILKINIPPVHNTSKPSKQNHGCRDLGLTIRPAWIAPEYPVVIWLYWSPDQRRIAVQLGHSTLMALCKIQKETCQMTSTRPLMACVRSTIGLGFLHTCLMGIFLACPTYLVSPVDFAGNPNILFQALSRYKIKDTYATSQMLDHAIANNAGKTSAMFEVKNLMISTDQRPKTDVYQRVKTAFAPSGLDRTAINTIYSHVLNPMVASRSYMCIDPIELYLDVQALRRGMVVPVDPDQEQFALLVQDSGMVPVSTQISIVNPETNRLCLVGEYGEIWVQSEANAYSFYGSRDAFDAERFNGRTVDGDPQVRYVRTGDLGFLHNVSRPIGPGGNMVEMQVLFVLGAIGETFEVNGLQHFPMDVEATVERCHRAIVRGGCAVFQAGSLLVLVAEVRTRSFLASLVPVIVNAVLNEHQMVLDIVAFVDFGDFPRSRLGEKQRGKILAGWVSRKMRTIAQFSIRDPEADGSVGTAVPDDGLARRGSTQSGGAGTFTGSLRRAAGPASSLRHVESIAEIPVVEESTYGDVPPSDDPYHGQLSAPPPHLDMDTLHPPLGNDAETAADLRRPSDATPTNETPRLLTLNLNPSLDYSPVEPSAFDDQLSSLDERGYDGGSGGGYHGGPDGAFSAAGPLELDPAAIEAAYDPYFYGGQGYDGAPEDYHAYDEPREYERGAGGGGLRVANPTGGTGDDWERDALRSLNLGPERKVS